MKLPDAAHLAQPWRIHALTPDFRLEDVWALPAEGAAGDFPRLVELIAAGDPSEGGSAIARALFAIRWKLGALFGWDDPDDAVPTLRDRVPAGLEGGPGSLRPRRRRRVPRAPGHPALSPRRRVGGRDRQPHDARRDAPRLGAR